MKLAGLCESKPRVSNSTEETVFVSPCVHVWVYILSDPLHTDFALYTYLLGGTGIHVYRINVVITKNELCWLGTVRVARSRGMSRHRTIPITIPSILEEVLMAWRRYWNKNPRPPRGGHHFPFCIFQPSFARFYEHSYRSWERHNHSRSSRSRPRSCNAYQCTRSKHCTEEEKEVWIRDRRTNEMTCVERTKEVSSMTLIYFRSSGR